MGTGVKGAVDLGKTVVSETQKTARTGIEQRALTQRREIEADEHKVTNAQTTVIQNYATYDRPWLHVDVASVINEFAGTELPPNCIRADISNLNMFLNTAWLRGGIFGHDRSLVPGTTVEEGSQRLLEMESYLAAITIMDNLSGHAVGVQNAEAPIPTDVKSEKNETGGEKARDFLRAWKKNPFSPEDAGKELA